MLGTRGGIRRAALAVIVLGLLLPFAPAQAATTTPVRILLVGDSMTEGSSGDWTWRYRLAKYLDASGVDYEFVGPHTTMLDLQTDEHTSLDYADPAFDRHHFARWGLSLHAVLDENATTPEDSIGWAVSTYQPDVVVELLGINDTLYGSPPQETLDVAQQFVSEVRAAKPATAVVVSTIPNVQYAHVSDFNTLLETTAPSWSTHESPVVLADPSPGWSAPTDTCDSTHPSAIGEVKIAAAEADALSLLGIGSPAPRPLPTPPVGPRTPAVLSAEPADGQVSLSWQLPPGGTAVLVSMHDATTGEAWHQLPVPLSGDSWVSGGLRNGHTYEYEVNVLKHDCLAADVDSTVAVATPEPPPPGPVSGLAVSSLDHALHASWSATTGATRYRVRVRPSGSSAAWQSYGAQGTSVTVPGLLAGQAYDVEVAGSNGGGRGPWSAVTTRTPTGVVPVAPRWRYGRARDDGTVALGWTTRRAANHYQVRYRRAARGSAWMTVPRRIGGTTTLVTGLRRGRTYVFEVRGADDLVLGPWSATRRVTIPRAG